MVLVFYLATVVLGCVIGSFLGVIINRLPRHESIIFTRSHCNHCRKQLKWFELFPILSYLLQRGKCRYCHKNIGMQTFLIETITGVCFFLFALEQAGSPTYLTILSFLYGLYMISSLIAIFFIDYDYSIIPDAIIYPGIVISFVYLGATSFPLFIQNITTAFITFMFFFFLFVLTRGKGMGFGDVKFSFLLGLFLGFPHIIFALYVAFLTGAAVAFILILAKKKKFRGATIPFGPFLSVGGLAIYYYGTILEKIFFRLFF